MKLIKAILALVLAAAVLTAGVLIWRGISKHRLGNENPTVVQNGQVVTTQPVDMSPGESGFSVTLTEAQLGVLLEQAVSEKVKVRDVGVTIDPGENIALSFSASTMDIAELIANSDKELPAAAAFALSLMPEYVELDMAAHLSVRDGMIEVEPTAFGIMGLSLGTSILPTGINEGIGRALQNFLDSNMTSVQQVVTERGKLTVSGALSF